MAQLTWRNVDAPNFSGSLDGFRTFSNLISNAGKSASDAISAYDTSISDGVNQGIMADLQRFQDPTAAKNALASGELLQGRDPRRISMDTLKLMNDQVGKLTTQDSNLYNHTRKVDRDTRMDGAAPAIFAYANAAQSGDQAALQRAWSQNEESLRGLRADQILDLVTKGGSMIGTGIGNRTSQFNLGINQRNDADQQAAIAVLNKIGPGLGSAQDVYPLFRNSKEYNALSESGKRLVQQGVTGMGYLFQGPSAIGGTGVPSSLGSGSPATAAIGGAVGAGTSRADRNANPGNLKAPDGTWVRSAPGFLGVDDGGFAKFDSPANGLAAMATQLSRYREGTQATGGKAVKTVEGIIGTWSPVSDPKNKPGSTNNYATYVAGKLGLNPGDEVPADKMPAMAQAMYEFESGNRSSADPATALATAAQPKTNARRDGADSKNELQLRTAQDNAGGMANVFAAMEDTKPTPASIAAQWADQKKFPGANQGAVVDLINDMVSKYGKYGVTANVAGAILENGGLTGATDWTQRLITNRFRAMGEWVPNDKYIEEQVDALKNGKTLVNASANQGTTTAKGMLDRYMEEQAAARAELSGIAAAARDRPELLAEAVPRAQRRLDAADAMLRQLSSSQQGTSNLQPVLDKPQPVATTVAGKATTAIAAAASPKEEKAPVRSWDGGKTWKLDLPEEIRDSSVPYYRSVPNPTFVSLDKKTFTSREAAEQAYREAESRSRK